MDNEKDDLSRISNNDKKSKKKWIYIIISAVVVIIIAFIIYYLTTNRSATSQVEEFKKAVEKDNSEKISEMLSTNDQKVTKTEAKHFVTYIKKEENKKRFDVEIDKIKSDIKNDKNEDVDLGHLTDKQGRTILNVKKNGTKMFFLDKVTFEPKYISVYVKGNQDDVDYIYTNSNDKKPHITAKKNKVTKLGDFMVGNYKIDAMKSFKNSTVNGDIDGQLYINTDKVNEQKRSIVSDNFEEALFKVNLSNEEKLKDLNLYINDEETNYKQNKAYGTYPAEESIEVYAKGEINNTVIKTEPEFVYQNKHYSAPYIDLRFNKSEVNKEVSKMKKQKSEVSKFMKDYTEALNKAYKEKDFDEVEEYFKEDTEVSKHIKSMVKGNNKSKYKTPDIKCYKDDGNEIKVVIFKEDKKGNKIESKYLLIIDRNGYKIKSYSDIKVW